MSLILQIINKKPPTGDKIAEQVKYLPKYKVILDKNIIDGKVNLKLLITLENAFDLKQQSSIDVNSQMHLIVGDNHNNILLYETIA